MISSKYVTDGLKEQLKTKDDVLQIIADIAADYDGCRTVKSLKDLVDEMRALALYGRFDINL